MRPKLVLASGAALMVGLASVALWLDPTQPRTAATGPARAEMNTRIDATAGAIYTAQFAEADGKEHRLGEWQHKLLVINFWATWCGPCKEEMPILARLQEKYAANNVQIVGIAVDSRVNVSNFAKKFHAGYPLLPDEAGAIEFSKRLGNRLGLLPFTVVLKPGGEPVFTRLGVVTEAEMIALITKNTSK